MNDSPNESMDFFDFLALLDKEYERLKWSHARREKHLLGKYGKKSRYYLTDEQLLELYEYLKSLPTKSPISRAKIGLKRIGL